MNLGAFSTSLTINDIQKSKEFYENLGFLIIGGDISQKWLILKNKTDIIGLFDNNIITFKSVRDESYQNLETFDASKSSLVVVENKPYLQKLNKMSLSENHSVVLTAGQGKAALNQLNVSPMTDMILNDRIMLTAKAEATELLKALRISADDYLLKPFEEEELLLRIENMLKKLSIRKTEAMQQKEQNKNIPKSLISSADKEWLENFENYIHINIATVSLSILSLSLEFAMSQSTLLRKSKRLTGLTPIQYIQDIRLNKALLMLESHTYNSIANVAAKVGYADTRSFSRSFKIRFGKLPTDIL